MIRLHGAPWWLDCKQTCTEVEKHWAMAISSGVRGTGRHEALYIILQCWRGMMGYQRLCNLASVFRTKTCVTKHWLANRDWLSGIFFQVSRFTPRVAQRFIHFWHEQKPHNYYSFFLNTVPSYMVMMCGWQSVDMISISLRIWTRSCSSLIFSFLMDFMATLKKKKKIKLKLNLLWMIIRNLFPGTIQ